MQFKLVNYSIHSPIAVVRADGYESIFKHTHDFVEVVYVVSGAGIHVVDNNSYNISAGDIFIVPLGCSHCIKPKKSRETEEDDLQIINIIFYDYAIDFDTSNFEGKPLYVKDDKNIVHCIESICKEHQNKYPNYIEVLKVYLQTLLLLVSRKQQIVERGKALIGCQDYIDEYVDKTIGFITENYANKIYVDDVADIIGLSKGYLQRIFKNRTGYTLIEYIIRYRIEESCRLLTESNKSISEIALLVGFLDVKHFYEKFEELMNLTPKRYRKQNAGFNL